MEGHCTILSFSFSIQKKLQVVSSPSKPVVVSSNHVVVAANSSANVGATVENRGVKRGADIDFEAFSDAKRRKTNEKGGKGEALWKDGPWGGADVRLPAWQFSDLGSSQLKSVLNKPIEGLILCLFNKNLKTTR